MYLRTPKNTVTWAPWVTFRKMRYLGFSQRSSWGSCPWASGSLNLNPKDTALLHGLLAAHVAKNLLAFWGTQNFVPNSQQPAPLPYPQPRKSSPRPQKLFVYNPFKWPASWSSGQGLWLLIMRSRARFPVLPWEFFLAGKDSRGDHGLGS